MGGRSRNLRNVLHPASKKKWMSSIPKCPIYSLSWKPHHLEQGESQTTSFVFGVELKDQIGWSGCGAQRPSRLCRGSSSLTRRPRRTSKSLQACGNATGDFELCLVLLSFVFVNYPL